MIGIKVLLFMLVAVLATTRSNEDNSDNLSEPNVPDQGFKQLSNGGQLEPDRGHGELTGLKGSAGSPKTNLRDFENKDGIMARNKRAVKSIKKGGGGGGGKGGGGGGKGGCKKGRK